MVYEFCGVNACEAYLNKVTRQLNERPRKHRPILDQLLVRLRLRQGQVSMCGSPSLTWNGLPAAATVLSSGAA
jgi:hypothetical protein